jgi:serine protease Do
MFAFTPFARRAPAVTRAVALGALLACSGASDTSKAAAQADTARVTSSANGAISSTPTSTGSFARIARDVTPAVVSIESQFSPEVAARMQGQEQGIPPELIPPQMRPQGPARATGSGFIVRKDGYILTNNHVVQDAQKVTVTLLDRRIFPATVIGHDPSTDVALIKINGGDLPVAPLGTDSSVQVGDPVLAIGNPLGLDFTVTSGIISAKGRSGNLRGLYQSPYAIVDFLQTDAVINPGNSGGPLVDMQGRVIGINSAIASPTGVYAGYGFAIPISIGKIVMDDFLKYGRVRRAILGVSIQDVGPADAQAAGLKEIRGALVGGFSSDDSPAKRAGLQPGDIITAINGRNIDRPSELERILLGYQPGQKVNVTVMRFGTQRSFDLTLGEAPNAEQMASAGGPSGGGSAPLSQQLGISVTPLTPAIASELQLPSNVSGVAVADVDPSGPASGQLVRGDVIEMILGPGQRRQIRTVEDLRQAVAAARGGVVSLLVYSPQAQGTRVVNMNLAK